MPEELPRKKQRTTRRSRVPKNYHATKIRPTLVPGQMGGSPCEIDCEPPQSGQRIYDRVPSTGAQAPLPVLTDQRWSPVILVGFREK